MLGEFLFQIRLTVDPDKDAFALRLAFLPFDIRLRHGHLLRHARPPLMKKAVEPVESWAKSWIIAAVMILVQVILEIKQHRAVPAGGVHHLVAAVI